jgi:glycosyltransferase involved in cell wall biosynthesis
MQDPKVRLCIGVPVYNGERFLRRTVESLLDQTFSGFQLVISDNASTDGTEEIARDLVRRDSRVRYWRHDRNLGLAANYNFVFRLENAEYFKWATADDPCEPRFLERCVSVLDRDPGAVLAYPRARFVDLDEEPLEIQDPGFPLDFEPPAKRLRYTIEAGHWVNAILGVIRTGGLARTRLMPRYPGGDYVLLGELCLQGRFVEIAEPLLLRRIHPEASSQLVRDPDRMLEYVAGRAGVALPAWLRLRDHCRTILASQLRWGDKLALLRTLLRATRGRREGLTRELIFAGRVALGSARKRLIG